MDNSRYSVMPTSQVLQDKQQEILAQIRNFKIREIAKNLMAGKEVSKYHMSLKGEDGITAAGHLARAGVLKVTSDIVKKGNINDLVKNALLGKEFEILDSLHNLDPWAINQALTEFNQLPLLINFVTQSPQSAHLYGLCLAQYQDNSLVMKCCEALGNVDADHAIKKDWLQSILGDNNYPDNMRAELAAKFFAVYAVDIAHVKHFSSNLGVFLANENSDKMLVARVLDKGLGNVYTKSRFDQFLGAFEARCAVVVYNKYRQLLDEAAVNQTTIVQYQNHMDAILPSNNQKSVVRNELQLDQKDDFDPRNAKKALTHILNKEIREIAERITYGEPVTKCQLLLKDKSGVTAVGHLVKFGAMRKSQLVKLSADIDVDDVVENAIAGRIGRSVNALCTVQPEKMVKSLIAHDQLYMLVLYLSIANSKPEFIYNTLKEYQDNDLSMRVMSYLRPEYKKECLEEILKDQDYSRYLKEELAAKYYVKYGHIEGVYLGNYIFHWHNNDAKLIVSEVLVKALGYDVNDKSKLLAWFRKEAPRFPEDLVDQYHQIFTYTRLHNSSLGRSALLWLGKTHSDLLYYSDERDELKKNTLNVQGQTVAVLTGNSWSEIILPDEVVSKILFLVHPYMSKDMCGRVAQDWKDYIIGNDAPANIRQ